MRLTQVAPRIRDVLEDVAHHDQVEFALFQVRQRASRETKPTSAAHLLNRVVQVDTKQRLPGESKTVKHPKRKLSSPTAHIKHAFGGGPRIVMCEEVDEPVVGATKLANRKAETRLAGEFVKKTPQGPDRR